MFKYLLVFSLFTFSLWSHEGSHHMQDILPYLENANAQTLVVFDIDFTLTMPSHPAFHLAALKQHKAAAKEWIKQLTEEEKFWLAPYMVMEGRSILIEKEVPALISSLQQKGIKLLALTGCPSENSKSAGSIVESRWKELKILGIDFSTSFPTVAPFAMNHFKEMYGCFPGFYQGILFCNFTPFCKIPGLATKGEVLRHFLEQANWKPEHVMLIDDDIQNLDQMAISMQEWGVSYTGLHYTGGYLSCSTIDEAEMKEAWMKLIQQLKEEKLKQL